MSNFEFKVPVPETDDSSFHPPTKLPEHLDEFAKMSEELRHKMTPVLQRILALTDKTALRSASLPQNQ